MNFTDSVGSKRKADMDEAEQWGGREIRVMLQVMYLISFLCLLRFDEALRIQWSWIQLDKVQNASGEWVHRITLLLPFRKTHQTGGKLDIALENLFTRRSSLPLNTRHCAILFTSKL